MKAVGLALALALAGCTAGAHSGVDTGDTPVDAGDLILRYPPPSSSDAADWRTYLKQIALLDQEVDAVNASFALPHDADIVVTECGVVNAFWSPQDQTLYLCYELLADIADAFVNSGLGLTNDQVIGGTVNTFDWVFFHELGHTLVDLLEIPITGREEDAVDQFSTVLFVEAGAGGAAIDAGLYFYLRDSGGAAPTQLADEHSLNLQRFYNVLCLVYGSDPTAYADILDLFPEMTARAPRCADEYAQASNSWTTLLEPHAL